eukprot:1838133-Pleurochrysis_carterae.AAC.1
MDLPAHMCLQQLNLKSDQPGMLYKPGERYTIDAAGSIQWKASSTISTYFISEMGALASYLSFHTRSVARGLVAYGSSKGAVIRKEG